MPRWVRWICAIVAPLGMFALIWWGWLALRLPPGDDAGRLAAALAVGGAVAVSLGAFLAWWAGREPETPPAPLPPAVSADHPVRSPVTGTNSGTLINADTVHYYGTPPPQQAPREDSAPIDAQDTGPPKAHGGPVRSNLPPRNPKFTGRETALTDVGRALTGGGTSGMSPTCFESLSPRAATKPQLTRL